MTDSSRLILVTGATGRQGGAVIRHLLPHGWKLRALTRQVQGAAVQQLLDQGVEIAKGDLQDPASLIGATRGCYGVYSVQDFWSVGVTREVQQGKNIADAAKAAGVRHFVFSSVGGAERHSGVDHFESKWEIEKYLRQLALPATILRPAGLMENYYIDHRCE